MMQHIKPIKVSDNIGLVFSGGGAKGAYQIGVWKGLIESGIDKQIKAVSGTSVGALNGAMFCQNDYESAEELWLGMRKLKILTPDAGILLKHIGTAIFAKGGVIGRALSIGRSIYNNGFFSRRGLSNILDAYLKSDLIVNSKIPLYICTLNTSESKLNMIKLNRVSEESIKSYLLATSAIPAIFKREKIGDHYHLDGGLVPFLKNNIPYEVLIEKEKCMTIINVYLSANPDLNSQKKYSEVKFINIYPSKSIKGFIPSLNFSEKAIHELIENGYRDAISTLRNVMR